MDRNPELGKIKLDVKYVPVSSIDNKDPLNCWSIKTVDFYSGNQTRVLEIKQVF